ncbi:Schwannomin-interacting protein 1 [Toxocara canis]|uniref:Schwannomin-interacting protein 1 n=1 Tax=Toxocara canis TaxID=6265 RepID=A0A0B2W0W0_TOXCA|nr:Schwannomin-interacting protein 1 [Toxocara canis]
MWSGEAVVPIESNNNNICADSLISSIVDGGAISPTDQQSNSSSLESLDSPILDDNRALSTSCSEDSFEMSSTTSRTAGDLPTPSDSFRFHTDSLKHSFDGQLESDPETEAEPYADPDPESGQLPDEKTFNFPEPSFGQPRVVNGFVKHGECKPEPSYTIAQNQTDVAKVLKAESESCQASVFKSNGHITPEPESTSVTHDENEWKIHPEPEAHDKAASSTKSLSEVSSAKDHLEIVGSASATTSTAAVGLLDTNTSARCVPLEDHTLRVPSASKSMSSIGNAISKEALQKSIDAELNSLDTCLPKLDFNKLEEQLNCAARERQIIERKLLGEQVRRRLALQVDQLTAGPSPRVLTRPSKSNLGFRLQTAMNLQVCYMNDMDDDEDEDDDSSDDDFGVPKSKSAPNLRGHVQNGSNMNATQLRQYIASHEPSERRMVLEEETKLMLAKAKETAKMQMELEKLYALRGNANPKKVTRVQLSKMTCRQLMDIYDQLSKRIDEENAELMRLLVERDSLHMQQDSMLVDIEDMIQHESNSECLNLPEFLKVQASTPSKFCIFKR